MGNRTNRWTVAAAVLVVSAVYSGRGWAADAAGPLGTAAAAPRPMADEAVPALTPAPPVAPEPALAPAPPVAPAPALTPTPERWPARGRVTGMGYPYPMSAEEAASRCSGDDFCPRLFGLTPPQCPPPCLYARFRALVVKRDSDEYVPFAALGETAPGAAPDIVLDTSSLGFPFSGGAEVLVGRMISPTNNVEFSYFGLGSWDRSAAVRDVTANSAGGTGNLFSPFGAFGNTPLDQFDFNDFASVRYRSRLNNYELNLRHQLPPPITGVRSWFLFGGRAMLVNDDLEYLTTSNIPLLGGTSNSILTRTRNRLLGLQIGALVEFHAYPGFWIDFGMKGAICQNKIRLYSDYQAQSGVGGLTTYSNSSGHADTSFVGDLDLSAIWECSRHLSVEIGYQAIWISGLALGAENFQTDPALLTLGPPHLNDQGTAVYHGPHAGLTVRW